MKIKVDHEINELGRYLVHSSKHLSCVGDALHRPTEDVKRELQPLQHLAALAVQTQALQCLQENPLTP